MDTFIEQIQQGQVMVIDSRGGGGLFLRKEHHIEFAGPGAAVGGNLDLDCWDALPIRNLLLLEPANHQEQQNAHKIRRQWIRLTCQIAECSSPAKRLQIMLNMLKQFEAFFGRLSEEQVEVIRAMLNDFD
ncbi:MAG: hypothetical protein AB4042_15180 [Leptolyngbyaceae cyanobacterium]